MDSTLKKKILNIKNDLVENTFTYLLFEEGIFDIGKLEELIDDSNKYLIEASSDKQITEILSWVVSSVEQCFISQHDIDDFYEIKNYDPEIEIRWNNYWKKQLLTQISLFKR